MRSHTSAAFRELLDAAPESIRTKAEAAYRIWAENPTHPSLRYKKVHRELPIYSVRIDRDWRAVGVVRDSEMLWFWIGPHDEYEKLLGKL